MSSLDHMTEPFFLKASQNQAFRPRLRPHSVVMKVAMLGSRLGLRMAVRSFSSKPKCVMLNAARLDFDGRMDWSKVTNATEFTSYDISSTEEIVPRAQGMDIVMNKELTSKKKRNM